jgi:hypothetical protein
VTPAAQLTIYRLVQEALTNVVKYAKATEVVVTLTAPSGGGALVSVRDNGVGFDTDLPRLQRHGLLGMRYRVEPRADDAAVVEARRGHADRSDAAGAARQQRRPRRSRRPHRHAGRGSRMNTSAHAVGRVLPGRGVSPDSAARAAPIVRIRQRQHTVPVVSSGLRAREAESATHQQRNSMDTIGSSTNKPMAQQSQDMADNAADAAQGAIRSTQRAADQALDRLSQKVDDVRSQAAPMINKVTSQAEAAARRGMEAVRDTSQQLRERALQAQDMTGRLRQGRADQGHAHRRGDGRPADGDHQHARPLARLSASRSTGAAPMIHPLLRLAATEPHLIGDHVEAYAALVGEEVSKVSTSLIVRIALYGAALCLVAVGLVLVGVALLFCAAVPSSGYPAPWADVRRAAGAVRHRRRLRRLRALAAGREAFRHHQEAAQCRHGDAARGQRLMSSVMSPPVRTTADDAATRRRDDTRQFDRRRRVDLARRATAEDAVEKAAQESRRLPRRPPSEFPRSIAWRRRALACVAR